MSGIERYDALVIGGGPAGSTCAWELQRAGLAVAVIDKRSFPRDKICAGWVTPAVLEALEFDEADYRGEGRIFQPIHAFRTGSMGAALVETRYPRPVSYGIRRIEFDDYLLGRSGATLRTGVKFEGMERRGGMWLVNDAFEAPILIGAGGHFCPVARVLGARPGASERIVAAQEIEFEMSDAQRAHCSVSEDTPELFFCPDLQGYGWVFRKGDVLNIGLGREDNRGIAEQVRSFCASLVEAGKIPADIPTRFKGHAYILHGHSHRPALGDAVLIVGDALGLAYTQSGEGIRPAVESALMAAQLVKAGRYDHASLAPYESRLDARFGARGESEAPGWVPPWLREAIAARLLATRWFSKQVVLERWFLHADLAPLGAG